MARQKTQQHTMCVCIYVSFFQLKVLSVVVIIDYGVCLGAQWKPFFFGHKYLVGMVPYLQNTGPRFT